MYGDASNSIIPNVTTETTTERHSSTIDESYFNNSSGLDADRYKNNTGRMEYFQYMEYFPPGVYNFTAFSAVVGMCVASVVLIAFYGCIILLMHFYYSDREEEMNMGSSFNNELPIVRVEKEKSPYVITPAQKMTQQYLTGPKPRSDIECNPEDIVGVLDFMATSIDSFDDGTFRTGNFSFLLVPRAKTKFDDAPTQPLEADAVLQRLMVPRSPIFNTKRAPIKQDPLRTPRKGEGPKAPRKEERARTPRKEEPRDILHPRRQEGPRASKREGGTKGTRRKEEHRHSKKEEISKGHRKNPPEDDKQGKDGGSAVKKKMRLPRTQLVYHRKPRNSGTSKKRRGSNVGSPSSARKDKIGSTGNRMKRGGDRALPK